MMGVDGWVTFFVILLFCKLLERRMGWRTDPGYKVWFLINAPIVVPCKVCGRPHQPGGYAHPTRCYHCSPTIAPRRKR